MKAIILHRADLQEYDQLIHLYTLEQGKLVAIARGSKRITSKNASWLLPGSVVSVGLQGNAIRPTITSVQPLSPYGGMKNPDAMKVLTFCLHWCDKVIKGTEPDRGLFTLFLDWITYLRDVEDPYDIGPIDKFFGEFLGCCGLLADLPRSHLAVLQAFQHHTEVPIPEWGKLRLG